MVSCVTHSPSTGLFMLHIPSFKVSQLRSPKLTPVSLPHPRSLRLPRDFPPLSTLDSCRIPFMFQTLRASLLSLPSLPIFSPLSPSLSASLLSLSRFPLSPSYAHLCVNTGACHRLTVKLLTVSSGLVICLCHLASPQQSWDQMTFPSPQCKAPSATMPDVSTKEAPWFL